MKKDVNQQSITANQSTDNQNTEKLISMETTDEAVRDLGIDRKKIIHKRRGNEIVTLAMMPVDNLEQYSEYMRPIWAEEKRKERNSRCLISDGKGKVIRCTNDCSQCEHYLNFGKRNGSVVSLDRLYEEANVEPENPSSMDETAIYTVILEELLKMLGEIKPKYSSIFELLYQGYNSREIAETLDIPNSTVKDDIRRLRKIVQECDLIKGIF
ncbi:RNA polymerase sigma factor [Desnuesiella massiliensis]|uniref:RNA polymerase sigma factor n=1 Tax=Desnuesiella massiliensis TaxID=1650662 RepID=UPI0006E42545|nr:sigma factor-like helix-turn-helix DNA-binding protein [Desnuesiella massiliensis]